MNGNNLPHHQLRYRQGCVLAPTYMKLHLAHGNSVAHFKCVLPKHKARFCASQSLLKLKRMMFQHRLSSIGNLLIEVFEKRCHACGEDKTDCWREYTGHYICTDCATKKDVGAPYPFGEVDHICCTRHHCGEKLGLFSESPQELLSRVVEIYERRMTLDF
jgi:hypothetical protein